MHQPAPWRNTKNLITLWDKLLWSYTRKSTPLERFQRFMQDNALCHKAKVVMSYLSEQDFEIRDWPPQSPDLNPIENLWKTLGVKVMERNPTNTEDLWVKLQEECSKISIEDCQELIRSCIQRCAAVIESKGSFTKYWLYMYFYCFLAVYIVFLNFLPYFWTFQIWK